MLIKIKKHITRTVLILLISFLSGCETPKAASGKIEQFNGERAYQDVLFQISLGPRIPGTPEHKECQHWIKDQLEAAGWQVEVQRLERSGKQISNLIAFRREQGNYLLLGAHYDTRMFADHDPNLDLRNQPVPGANDGGSGVAVLLELARVLPKELPQPIRLVFFDAEDNGGIDDWDWILGSRAYVEAMETRPDSVVIVDMVGDVDLNIYKELNSDEIILSQIWTQANNLGYGDVFVDEYKHSILDDHTPFLEAGIPAADIIDFDYPYWHTTEDTADKVSSRSLQVVGDTLFAWLLSFQD